MRFVDRVDAGRQLGQRLLPYRNEQGVVYALPRGGVPIGAEVARAIGWPLELIIARKIGHPGNPEYAIAAVTETGPIASNPHSLAAQDEHWFKQAVTAERKEAERRRKLYLSDRPAAPIAGKIAIVVDDGVATGLTIEAALTQVFQRGPAKLVLAVPVAPRDTAARLSSLVDELVVLELPVQFLGAVGAYYSNFDQVTDAEVVALLDALSSRDQT